MKLENKYRFAYLLGIGGIGMSAVARYLKKTGIQVFGYDRTSTALTDALINEGIEINFEDDAKAIPKILEKNKTDVLWIYTPAIPQNSEQKIFLENSDIELLKRSEVLELITKQSICLAVAGTHGKTTTSTYLAHILKSNNINFSSFLGGISSNYNSNYIEHDTGIELFDKPIIVIEADEFDRSFHRLNPQAAIITSVDADHLDIYSSAEEFIEAFQIFTEKVQNNSDKSVPTGLIINDKISVLNKTKIPTWYYGSDSESEYVLNDLQVKNHKFNFTLSNKKAHIEFTNGLPGIHNSLNAVAAITLCNEILQIEPEALVDSIASFKGVKRRFEIIYETDNRVIIDDYAHHPSELKSFIDSVKLLYPNKKITGVFQPHLYTRTRDFEEGFIEELAKLDELILMEIYPARELPIEGINSQSLLSKINHSKKHLMNQESVIEFEDKYKPEVFIIMDAGNIDQISQKLKIKYEQN